MLRRVFEAILSLKVSEWRGLHSALSVRRCAGTWAVLAAGLEDATLQQGEARPWLGTMIF